MLERSLKFDDLGIISEVFGKLDENVKAVEDAFGVSIGNIGGAVKISGDNPDKVDLAERVMKALANMAQSGQSVTRQSVDYAVSMACEGREEELAGLTGDSICITAKGRPIKPKTLGQKEYINAIRANTITLGIGPAGTGKTYLAVAMAVTALRQKKVSRIILTRPAVEAGEKLGFLPGDLQNKVDPYLRPLTDALFDMLGMETYQSYLEKNVIEIAPLAYMRGRTLDDSFIILDEAQNTTCEQMKMFLTRLGFNSKIIITGDITQIDLPRDKRSGLKQAMSILKGVEDIAICNLTFKDVVRHHLVQRIIQAYEKDAAAKADAPHRFIPGKRNGT